MNLNWYWMFFEGEPLLPFNGQQPSTISCLMNEYKKTLYTRIRYDDDNSFRVRCEAPDVGQVKVFVATDSSAFKPVEGVQGLREYLHKKSRASRGRAVHRRKQPAHN